MFWSCPSNWLFPSRYWGIGHSDGGALASGPVGYFDIDTDAVVRDDGTLGAAVGVEVDDMVLGEHLDVAVHIGIVPAQRVSEGLDALWAVWHLPLFYIPSQTIYYNLPLFGFFISTAFLSVLHTWLYNNTNRSLLPALLFHTAFNWANGMFPVLESDPASLTLLILLAAITVEVVAYWGPSTLSRSRSRDDATV